MRFVNGHQGRVGGRPPLSEAEYELRDCGYETPCRVWLRGTTKTGYGTLWETRDGKPRCMLAHRVYYEREVGPIPPGAEVHHKCEVRPCVETAHMKLRVPLTHAAEHLRPTCPHGHPLSGANLYERPDGKGRDCVTCRREANQRSAERKKAARGARGLIRQPNCPTCGRFGCKGHEREGTD
jgi:HNH endonuclease